MKDSTSSIKASILATISYLDKAEELANKETSILLTDDSFIKNINSQTRDKNAPTNVLSFPNMEYYKGHLVNPDNSGLFGEMIFAYETIEREASEQGKDFNSHLSHLVVHSTLHLFGFDHMKDVDAEEMENLEIKILQNLQILNPYIEK